jgi:hypothetical protein
MKINLVTGQFKKKDAIDLISHLIHVKIQFHEKNIDKNDNEDDIKMREKRIIQLQKDLFEARKYIDQNTEREISLEVEIKL